MALMGATSLHVTAPALGIQRVVQMASATSWSLCSPRYVHRIVQSTWSAKLWQGRPAKESRRPWVFVRVPRPKVAPAPNFPPVLTAATVCLSPTHGRQVLMKIDSAHLATSLQLPTLGGGQVSPGGTFGDVPSTCLLGGLVRLTAVFVVFLLLQAVMCMLHCLSGI